MNKIKLLNIKRKQCETNEHLEDIFITVELVHNTESWSTTLTQKATFVRSAATQKWTLDNFAFDEFPAFDNLAACATRLKNWLDRLNEVLIDNAELFNELSNSSFLND